MRKRRSGITSKVVLLPLTVLGISAASCLFFFYGAAVSRSARGHRNAQFDATSTPVQLIGGHLAVDGTVLAGADPRTFVVLNGTYAEDAHHVYVIVGGEEPYIGQVAGVSRNTFSVVGGAYAKDARQVYWNGLVVAGANPQTFVYLGYGYAKDDAHVYWEDGTLPLVTGVRTAQALPGGLYLKDANHVYVHTVDMQGVVEGADVKTFTPIVTADDASWATDIRHVYYLGKIVAGADPKTFKLLNDVYGKDPARVYALGVPVLGADPATFVTPWPQNVWFGKDATHIFVQGELLQDADVATFKVLTNQSAFTPSGNWYNAYDKNHYYDYGKIVE